MAYQNFLISAYLKYIWELVMYEPFLNGNEQLTNSEVKENQAIAPVGIY